MLTHIKMTKKSNICIIIKIGETELSEETLRGGEPLAFARKIDSLGTSRVLVYEPGKRASFTHKLFGDVISYSSMMDIQLLVDDVDTAKVFLWQGIKLKETENGLRLDDAAMAKFYVHYNKLISFLKASLKDVKTFFVQTDIKIPLFQSNLSHLNTNGLILLSQARIDYRKDIKEIFRRSASKSLFEACEKNEIITEFQAFVHLPLEYIVYDERREMVTSRKHIKAKFTASYVTQNVKILSGIRKAAFYDVICSNKLNTAFNLALYGKVDDSDMTSIIKAANYGNIPKCEGLVNWNKMIDTLSQSIFSICVNDEMYENYGVIPNRIVESIFARSMPVALMSENMSEYLKNYDLLVIDAEDNDTMIIRMLRLYDNYLAYNEKINMQQKALTKMHENFMKSLETIVDSVTLPKIC